MPFRHDHDSVGCYNNCSVTPQTPFSQTQAGTPNRTGSRSVDDNTFYGEPVAFHAIDNPPSTSPPRLPMHADRPRSRLVRRLASAGCRAAGADHPRRADAELAAPAPGA